MLQNMRDNLKSIGIAIVVIISIPFILTGADQFFLGGNPEPQVAEVNGLPITATDIAREVGPQGAQMLEQHGDSIRDLLQQRALNSLILRLVIQTAAEDNGMAVARETLNERIREIPAFQNEGEFDRDLYLQVLAQHGYDAHSFTKNLQRDLLGNQFVQGVLASEFITEAELAQNIAVAEQERDFYYLTVPLAPLLETLEIAEATVLARYQESKDKLVVPEQVIVEYIELSRDALSSSLQVDEAEVRQRFAEELAEAGNNSQPQRRLAHILISDEDESRALEVITALKARLDAGEDFAELAKAHSRDSGTAGSGGDLGFIDPSVLPEPLAEAAAALEPDAVSGPVKSDSGYHLVKVTAIEKASLPTFDGQQQRIVDEIKTELAENQYAIMLEQLKGAAYDIFGEDSLQTVADDLGLQMQLSEPFPRSGGSGVAAEPAVAATAFSKQVLADGYSSEVLELGDGRAVVVKLKERIPERARALEEVRDQLTAELKQERAREQVTARGEQLLARVAAGESLEAVASAEQLAWQQSLDTKRAGGNLDPGARSQAFAMPAPTAGQPQTDGRLSDSGDYILVQLTAVEYPAADKLPEAQRQSMLASLQQSAARRGMDAYQKRLLEQADISQ